MEQQNIPQLSTLQLVFDIMMIVVGGLGGWVLNTLWGSIRDAHSNHQDLAKEVNAVHVLVAGEYVKRSELEKINDSLISHMDKICNRMESNVERSLSRIEGKLDQKADKE